MPRAFLHLEVDAAPASPGGVLAREFALKGLLSELTDRVETLGQGRLTADLPRVATLQVAARALEDRIRAALSVSSRIGVAPNLPLARLASRAVRPSGVLVIDDAAADHRVGALPVDAIHGIGPVSQRCLEGAGIRTVADLLSVSEARVMELLGSVTGVRVLRAVHGREPLGPRRSRSSERTFPAAVRSAEALERELERQLAGLMTDLGREHLAPRTLTVKVRAATGEVTTRTRTLTDPCGDGRRLTTIARSLLHDHTNVGVAEVRTLGVSLAGFGPSGTQLTLPFH